MITSLLPILDPYALPHMRCGITDKMESSIGGPIGMKLHHYSTSSSASQ